MQERTEDSSRRLTNAQAILQKLRGIDEKYTVDFFANQWAQQKAVQQDVMSATQQKLKKRIGVLLDLEEGLLEAR